MTCIICNSDANPTYMVDFDNVESAQPVCAYCIEEHDW